MLEAHRRSLPLTCSLLAGCAGWPTYRHVDPGNDVAVDASVPPGDALWRQTSWTGPVAEAPNNEFPTEAIPLPSGTGWVREGALQGWGWDPAATADKTPPTGCQGASDFPPTRAGDYTGDLDWFGLAPAEAGTLCATVRFDLPEDIPVVRYDLLLYHLDECRTPVEAWREPSLESPANPDGVLGFTLGSTEDGWGVPVDSAGELGIVLAGVWPDDDLAGETITIPWTLAVSLVPTGRAGEAGLCPTLPESL